MREQADLAAMVGLVSQHVAEHLDAGGPGCAPAIAAEFGDAAFVAEGFGQQLDAKSGTVLQCGARLLRSAAIPAELSRDSEMRCVEPDPLGAHVMHVGEDGRDGADLAGGFSVPGGRIEVLDEHLVHAVVGGKEAYRTAGDLRWRLSGSLGHTSGL